jgi:hypothetical protein
MGYCVRASQKLLGSFDGVDQGTGYGYDGGRLAGFMAIRRTVLGRLKPV